MKTLFPYSSIYTAIAIAYRNISLIGDLVLPRVVVGKKEFKYKEFPLADGYTIPDTLYPLKGKPNEVEFGAIDVTSSTIDYGLSDFVPNDDIDNAPEGYDPLAHAVQQLTDLLDLGREVRVANLIFNAGNYASDKVLALSGTSKFSDYANSDPIGVITDALDTCLIRPNTMTIGRAAWSKLSQHPKIVKATNKSSGDSGIATRIAVAELLELQSVLVGESRLNTAKKGQNPTLSRVWGNDISLTYINQLANTQNGITFGFTAQYGTKQAGANTADRGKNGSMEARSADSVKELIVAKDTGFLIQNVI